MFAFAAVFPFAPMRKDLIAMVPPTLPRPDLIVFVAGILELAGAIGVLIGTRSALGRGGGLIALLIAIFQPMSEPQGTR